MAHGFSAQRGRYEAKERDSRFLEKEKERATARGARYHQAAGARAATAGALNKATRDFDEVRAQRIVKRLHEERAGLLRPALSSSLRRSSMV
jgi:hypothetical protein